MSTHSVLISTHSPEAPRWGEGTGKGSREALEGCRGGCCVAGRGQGGLLENNRPFLGPSVLRVREGQVQKKGKNTSGKERGIHLQDHHHHYFAKGATNCLVT